MQGELSDELATVKGHRPLEQAMTDMENLQFSLGMFVRSTEEAELGPKRVVSLIKQVIVRLLGRKRGFDFTQKPRSEYLKCPPWSHRLKTPQEKREREGDHD